MLLSRFASFFSKHFSTGRPLKRQWRGGKGTEKESERDRGLWVTVALPLHLHSSSAGPLASLWHPVHWGLICLAHCLCTLLLLVTFWCHGVTMKWLPSHVAARGGATSGTMRSRGVGAGTQEAPAGRNALTLPPPRLPWNRELVEALLTTSQCLCVPGSSQGLAGTRGEERQRHRHSDQGMGALGVTGGNLYVLLWPLTLTEIKLCLTHGTVGEWVVFVSGGAGMGQQKGQKPYCRVIFTVTPNGWCISTVQKTCNILSVCYCGNDNKHCVCVRGGQIRYFTVLNSKLHQF